MKIEEKINISLSLNIAILLLILLPNFSAEFLMPGEADKMIAQSQIDLNSMAGLYNHIAKEYNEEHQNQSYVMEYNPNFEYLDYNEFLAARNLKELVALKNEGTARFDVFFADAHGSDNHEKILMTHEILVKAGIQEKALQKALAKNDEELVKVVTVSGGLLLVFLLYLRRGKRQTQEEGSEPQ